jgi:hemolysin activation/secretion protein
MKLNRIALCSALAATSVGVMSATLGEPVGVKNSDGKHSYSWAISELAPVGQAMSFEMVDVGHYLKAGTRPPGSLSDVSLQVTQAQGQPKLVLSFFAKESVGQVGVLHEGRVYWVSLNKAELAQAVASPGKQVTTTKDDAVDAKLGITAVSITGRPLVGETVGVDFAVVSNNKNDPLARTRVTWLLGESRQLVGAGRTYLVHEADKFQPLFALITPVTKSGMRGQATEVSIGPVATHEAQILPAQKETAPIIAPQRVWSFVVKTQVQQKEQNLIVSMNASQHLAQADVEKLMTTAFANGVNTQNLKTLVDGFSALYKAKKLPEFKALVPEQSFSDGNLQLILMEPVVGNLAFSGHENEPYLTMLKHRLGIQSGQLLDLEAIDTKIQIFNMRNRGKARVLLAPGDTLGESDVMVDVAPAPKVEITANVNNTGSEQTGRQMRSVKATVFGQLYGTETIGVSRVDAKSLSVMGVTVDVPLANRDLVLGVGRTEVNSKPIDNPIDLASKGSTTYFQVLKPLVISPNLSYDFSFRASNVVNGTSFLGETVKNKTNANKYTLGVSQDLLLNTDWMRSRMATGAQFTMINTHFVDIYNDTTDSRATKLNLNLLYQLDASSGWGGKLEFNAQPQRKFMPLAEKFVVGMDNVRAYKPGAAQGDAGMSTSLDIYKTMYVDLDDAGTKLLTQPYAFVDYANVRDGAFAFASTPYKAMGYGLKVPFFAAYKGFSFDVYKAKAMASSASRPSGQRFGFSLNYLY